MLSTIFGPVPSRRLNISLGVDIVPFKTCTLNCIYCECGATSHLTAARQTFIPVSKIINDLEIALDRHHHIDYITFSGSGEPTLHSGIGEMIAEIKQRTPIPVAVLTNSTLLTDPAVRRDLSKADLILPSLDAASPEAFVRINRPHSSVKVHQIIDGLKHFRQDYPGEIWLEVFIVKGINDSRSELNKLHKAILEISPNQVQLNSLDRPPAVSSVRPVSIKTLESIQRQWYDLQVSIIKRAIRRKDISSFSKNFENSLLNTIQRRPLTIDDLVDLTGRKRVELLKYLDILEKEKKLVLKIVENKIFYTTAL